MKDFRPISLRNMAYKIIAKIMASRLRRTLPALILDAQAAFVHDRSIHDNILIAYELLHALKSSNKCSEEFITIKTDISKAFDRVEWSFLERALGILGFAPEWISLIMKCISSVNYQVLINGQAYGSIIPTCGIRQGDPLSPYLFIICTEMLVRLLKKAEDNKKISGLKVARRAPPITHIFFADDIMFYCKEKDEEIDYLVGILKKYSLASGKRIKFDKSSVCFGKKIPSSRRESIKEKKEIVKEGGEGIYLGLPESFGG